MELKTIKISQSNWKRLMKWKINLNAKNIDEVIDKVLKIVPASEMKQ